MTNLKVVSALEAACDFVVLLDVYGNHSDKLSVAKGNAYVYHTQTMCQQGRAEKVGQVQSSVARRCVQAHKRQKRR